MKDRFRFRRGGSFNRFKVTLSSRRPRRFHSSRVRTYVEQLSAGSAGAWNAL
jgi:hypothetical protein